MKEIGKTAIFGLMCCVAVLTLTAFSGTRIDFVTNYIDNGGFESGYYQHNGIPEVTVPNNWNIWYAEENTPKIYKQDDPWRKPETVVWNGTYHPEPERSLFWNDGNYTFKAFGAWKPIWVKLWQNNDNVVAGQRYKFIVPMYPDLIESYAWDGRKIVSTDPAAGEHRLIVTENGRIIADTGYLNGNDVPFLQWTDLELEFVPSGSEVRLQVEFRGKWGLINNGWFIDKIELKAIPNLPTATPRATATPTVTPTPEASKQLEMQETFIPIINTYSRRN